MTFGLWLVRSVRRSMPTSVSWLPDARSSEPCLQYRRGRRFRHLLSSQMSNRPSFLLCWSSSTPTAAVSPQIWSVKALHIVHRHSVSLVPAKSLTVENKGKGGVRWEEVKREGNRERVYRGVLNCILLHQTLWKSFSAIFLWMRTL